MVVDEDGLVVEANATATEALGILAGSEPRIDTLLTDVVMPGRDGLELRGFT